MSTVKAGDATIEYCSFGRGKRNLVVLPGVSVKKVSPGKEALEAFFYDFADDFTVYVFDMESDPRPGCTIKDLSDAAFGAMESLGMDEASLYAVSEGGMIALQLALDHPEMIGRMVVGSSSPAHTDLSDALFSKWISLAVEGRGTELGQSFMAAIYSENSQREYAEFFKDEGKDYRQDEMDRFAVLANAMLRFDVRTRLPEIENEMLVMCSLGDRVFTDAPTGDIAEKTGCESYCFGKEFGHAVYDEAPGYRKKALEFLTR